MAIRHNLTEGLDTFTSPLHIQAWKNKRIELKRLEIRINVINRRLIDLGKEIDGAQKERDLIKKAQKILERQKIQKEELEPLLADPLFTLEKDLAGFDKIFDTAILAYARSSSHSFAAAMHKSLPRELRDEVYEYLLDDVTVNVIGRQVRWQVDHAHCNRGVCFEAIPIPQFLEPEFAPVDLRKEILQISAMKYRWACTDIFTPPNFEACKEMTALDLNLDVGVSEFFGRLVFPCSSSEGSGMEFKLNDLYERWKAHENRCRDYCDKDSPGHLVDPPRVPRRWVDDTADRDWIPFLQHLCFIVPGTFCKPGVRIDCTELAEADQLILKRCLDRMLRWRRETWDFGFGN